MPSVSRRQFRLMKAVEQGDVKLPGLSKEEAAEFTEGQKYSKLPESADEKKKKAKSDALESIRKKYLG